MLIKTLHGWNVDIDKAKSIQETLRWMVKTGGQLKSCRVIAGCDVAYEREGHQLVGCVVLWDKEEDECVEVRFSYGRARFPYIPGYLSFRECFVLLKAFSLVQNRVDVVLVDGHGIAHPRGLGLASHLGLHLEVPTVGCAKNSLLRRWEQPGPNKGDLQWILWEGYKVSAVIRTKKGVRPVFVSPGHLISLEDSVRVVMECVKDCRMPEPLRRAHVLAEGEKRKIVGR